MILPDFLLAKWALSDGITPFDPACINPASVDLKLSGRFVDLHTGKEFLDNTITICPGDAILASTIEEIRMPDDCAGTIYLKSSLARSGLDHALAGWIDPGFFGSITLELHAHREITLHRGQRVVQLVLQGCICKPEKGYDGKYQGQSGPTRAR